MKTALDGVRQSVAVSLYKRYRKLLADPAHRAEAREELDHALTLVLNGDRAADVPEYLERSVARDARRTLARRRARHPEDDVDTLADTLAGSSPDPEQLLIAKQAFTEIASAAKQLAPDAVTSLEGLLLDESVEESAARSNISPRRVRHLRAQLRRRAAALPAFAEAA